MKRNITKTPEKWVVLKLPANNYKVFASWAGNYVGTDSWCLNSGIGKTEEEDDFYYFFGYSGSCYKCHKKSYGVATSYAQRVLDTIIERGDGEIQLLNYDEIGVIK
jgi:hypothetical protein